MKWATKELRKLVHIDNRFQYSVDLTDYLQEDMADLIGISPVTVEGNFHYLEEEDRYLFQVTVECTLTMACAITLEPVDVPLRFATDLEFGHEISDDNTLPIIGDTIDLDPAIFASILIEKPMRALSPNAYDHYEETIVELDEDEKMENNPFAQWKKKP